MPVYRLILKKALTLTSRHPLLWLLGVLAVLSGSSDVSLWLQFTRLEQTPGFFSDLAVEFFSNANTVLNWQILKAAAAQPLNLIISLLILVLEILLVALLAWLVIVGLNTLVVTVISLAKNKPKQLKTDLRFSISKFWPVFTVVVGTEIIFWFLTLLISTLAIFFLKLPSLIIIAAIVLLPIVIIVSFLAKYALFQLLLLGQTLKNSFALAWRLFKDNWLISLEFALLLFGLTWLATVVVDNIFKTSLFYLISALYTLPKTSLAITNLIFFLFELAQIIILVFYWTSWILFFEYLTTKKVATSRLVLGLEKIFVK